MKRIARYIFSQLLIATILVTLTISCALWLTQSLRFIELIVNRGLSIGSYLYLTLLLLPSFLAMLLPIGLFAALIFTYNRLTADSELIIMRAVGLSPARLAYPGLVLAVAIAITGYSLALYFMPLSYREFKDMESDVRSGYSVIMLREGAFNTISQGLTIYIRVRETDGELRGIIMHDSRDIKQVVTVMAERGILAQSNDGPRVIMVDGNRQLLDRETGKLSLLYFERYTADIGKTGSDTQAAGGRWREPRERFLNELFFPGDSDMDRANRSQLRIEGHERLTLPLYAIAFAMIAMAALLPGDYNRRGQGERILTAVILIIVIQAGQLIWNSVTPRYPILLPLIYANVLLPMAAASWWMMRNPRRRRLPAWVPEPTT
jgi:lipopolysaccharide export system permease protein